MKNVINNLKDRAALNNEFEEKLAETKSSSLLNIRARRLKSEVAINDALRRESLSKLTTVLHSVYDLLGFDEERLDRRLKMVRRSLYGRVPEMINILASIYAFPVEGGDMSHIAETQAEIIEHLETLGIEVDGELLLDVKEAKGYTSFLNPETFEKQDGVEPDYEEYMFFIDTIAEAMSLPYVDHKLSEAAYQKAEDKAAKKVLLELEAAEKALAEASKLAS